jgi:hypothetical protein
MTRRGRRLAGAVVAVAVIGGVTVAVTRPFGGGRPAAATSGAADNGAATSVATIAKRSLSAQTLVDATLGYAGSYSIVNQAQGILTALPAIGQVVGRGQVAYRVNGSPVVLFYGTTPAYRTLAQGLTAAAMSGPDVQQLNANLVALGYAGKEQIDPTSDQFTAQTKAAVKKLQAILGVTADGALALGQVVFVPTAARVTALAANVILGAQAQPGASVLEATSPNRLVTIALDAAQQSVVKAGDAVTITLPDQHTTPGVVWSVGSVATTPTGGGQNAPAAPTIAVSVVPTDPSATGTLDQAPVTVAITTATVHNVLVVPVNALLALATGGYAVEQVAADGTHQLVEVTIGLFDDAQGLVEVSGSALAAGQNIVVPGV